MKTSLFADILYTMTVSLEAMFCVIRQRSSWRGRCLTTQKTASKETKIQLPYVGFRYVTVLPPVHLGVNIDTDIFVKNSFEQNGELFTDGDEFTTVYGTVKLEESQANGQETPAGGKETLDAKYYHNALSCVVLGVVVMIILFFVCKFLNDLQVNPRSGSGLKRTGYGRRALVESVPFSLRGHTQVCPLPIPRNV